MTDRNATHSTFVLERTYPADTAKVFAAWAEKDKKSKWFGGGEGYQFDFRVGGQEIARGEFEGTAMTFTTTYADIVPGERIAYTSTMYFGDTLGTLTLTTVEFTSTGDETKLVLTEHGAYLDGQEKPEWREHGTSEQLDALGKALAS